jgi:RNA-binding protein YlmH
LADRSLEWGTVCYSAFLDERLQAIAAAALQFSDCARAFWGGHPDAMRRMLGIAPKHLPIENGAYRSRR